MIEYNLKRRLHYIPGGAIRAEMGMWPSGGNWWEPTTGSFTCVAAYQAKGAASLAASYVNLANPGTYDAAPGTAPSFNTATGWTFNASGQYLNTGVIPTANQGGSIFFRFTNAGYTNTVIMGVYESDTVQLRFYPNHTNNLRYYQYNGSVSVSPNISSGVMGVAGTQPYLDGSADGSPIASQAGTFTRPLYIGSLNNSGSALPGCGSIIQAVAIYSTTLDATQVGEITTAMNAL